MSHTDDLISDHPPVFIRNGEYWNICREMELPECHPDDNGWLISMLYNIDTKCQKVIYTACDVFLNDAQRKCLIGKYSAAYLDIVNSRNDLIRFSLARREANSRLRKAKTLCTTNA